MLQEVKQPSKSFNLENRDHLHAKLFLDDSGPVSIARFDNIKYEKIDKMTQRHLSFFWRPEEVDVSKDRRDFNEMSDVEKHIFTSNLKRQIMLDSIQGRSPNTILLPIVSNPEAEAFIETWGFGETIHSRSYTHIIRNAYNNPSEVFDTMLDIPEIVDCANSISQYYDELDAHNIKYAQTGIITKDHKKALWMALMAINALEGLRFYVSFACSWNFAQLKKMVGNANIIRLICRDENIHLAFTQYLIKTLPQDDPDFITIQKECEGEATKMYIDVIEQEKSWAEYLFQYGGMIGLNERIAKEYIEWLSVKRMSLIGLNSPYKGKVTSNPLPWTNQWISSSEVQNANQENENTSYVIGAIQPDAGEMTSSDIDIGNLIMEQYAL